MIFRMKATQSSVLHLRVTPDAGRAAELRKRMSSLDYCPENGFHRDQRQDRQLRIAGRPAWRK
jgi:hypothetical protein